MVLLLVSNEFAINAYFYIADMNSRRVKAGREMTGDSGVLNEVSGACVVNTLHIPI